MAVAADPTTEEIARLAADRAAKNALADARQGLSDLLRPKNNHTQIFSRRSDDELARLAHLERAYCRAHNVPLEGKESFDAYVRREESRLKTAEGVTAEEVSAFRNSTLDHYAKMHPFLDKGVYSKFEALPENAKTPQEIAAHWEKCADAAYTNHFSPAAPATPAPAPLQANAVLPTATAHEEKISVAPTVRTAPHTVFPSDARSAHFDSLLDNIKGWATDHKRDGELADSATSRAKGKTGKDLLELQSLAREHNGQRVDKESLALKTIAPHLKGTGAKTLEEIEAAACKKHPDHADAIKRLFTEVKRHQNLASGNATVLAGDKNEGAQIIKQEIIETAEKHKINIINPEPHVREIHEPRNTQKFWNRITKPISELYERKKSDLGKVMGEIDHGGMLGYFRVIFAFTVAQFGIGALINVFKGPGPKPEDLAAIHAAHTNPPPPSSGKSQSNGEGQTATATATVTAADMQAIEAKTKDKQKAHSDLGRQLAFRGLNAGVVAGAIYAINKLMFTPKGGHLGGGGKGPGL